MDSGSEPDSPCADAAFHVVVEEVNGREVPILALDCPPCHPLDGIWVMVQVRAFGIWGGDLWPQNRPPSREEGEAIYRQAFGRVIDVMYPGLLAVGVLPSATPRTAGQDDALWRRFCGWEETVFRPALDDRAFGHPRLRAIRQLLDVLRMKGLLPRLAPDDHVKRVLEMAKRRGRIRELGDNPETNVREEDVLSAACAKVDPKMLFLTRDEHGRPSFRMSYGRVLDSLAKGSRSQLELDPVEGLPERPDPNPGSDPHEVESQAEIARLVRELRDSLRQRGPRFEAALKYLHDGGSRRERAEEHDVSEEAVRAAEHVVRAELVTILRKLGRRPV